MARMHRYGLTKGKCRCAGPSNGTFFDTYFSQYRPQNSAPAEHFGDTYMYHFVIHMDSDGGTRGKMRCAGTGNGTCTGAYFN